MLYFFQNTVVAISVFVALNVQYLCTVLSKLVEPCDYNRLLFYDLLRLLLSTVGTLQKCSINTRLTHTVANFIVVSKITTNRLQLQD